MTQGIAQSEQMDTPPSGFDFSNYQRNQMILASANETSKNLIPTKAMKTGTTIVGITYAGGVVLGADTRATNGTCVAEKNCTKIDYIAPNMYCCGAGTAADTTNTCAAVSRQLDLLRMDMHAKESKVVTAVTLFKRKLFPYQGHISAALVLGGCDSQGAHVYQIYPHGSTSKLPYTSMGSGSLAAMAVLESTWKPDMTEEEAVQLVQRAIAAGIFNDLGSGSNCDLCLIRTDGTADYRRNAVKPNEVGPLRAAIPVPDRFSMAMGTTPILATDYVAHPAVTLADVTVTDMDVES